MFGRRSLYSVAYSRQAAVWYILTVGYVFNVVQWTQRQGRQKASVFRDLLRGNR